MPRTLDDKEFEPLTVRVRDSVDRIDWVESARLRLRAEGRFLAVTAYVLPRRGPVAPHEVEAAESAIRALHWRLYSVDVLPRTELRAPSEGRLQGAGPVAFHFDGETSPGVQKQM